MNTNHNSKDNDMSAVQYEDIQGGGSFAKFESVGDKVEGTVISAGLTSGSDFDNNPCPQITVNTADGPINVTCSNANLKAKAEAGITNGKIAAGAPILIELTGFYDTTKGSKGKEFRVATGPVPAPALTEI